MNASDDKGNVALPRCIVDALGHPCPVCGSAPMIRRDEKTPTGAPEGFSLLCLNCGVEPQTPTLPTPEAACADWCRRAEAFADALGSDPRELLDAPVERQLDALDVWLGIAADGEE